MKNLDLLELKRKSTEHLFLDNTLFVFFSDKIFFLENGILTEYNLLQETKTELCPQCFDDSISLKVLAIENKICVVTINRIHIFDLGRRTELKSVAFEHDISAISWNPTEELVAIVTSNGLVATYIIDYENGDIYSKQTSSVNTSIPDTVYVGWGSKDTQFRGSEGKLKNVAVEVKPVTNKTPIISWRGNGEMFVINYWLEDERRFTVFETPCKALFKSEACPGLLNVIAWRPSGNMIACVTECNNVKRVVIFEKNGQKRFSFELENFQELEVKKLMWSPCAHILCILSEHLQEQTLHLFTSSNYKWFEKQTLIFKAENPLLYFDWSESSQFTFTLEVITKLQTLKYIFKNVVNNSNGICARVAANKIELTDFSDSVIPPIMCLKTVEHKNNINFICLNENVVATIDCENKITYIANNARREFNLNVLVKNHLKIPLAFHHFILKDDTIIFACESSSKTVIYELNACNTEVRIIDASRSNIRHLLNLELDDSVIYQTDKVQLHSNGHFYYDHEKLGECVNSFIIFKTYLLFTTKLNKLHCVRLNDSCPTYQRSIEQGAIIVSAIPNSPKIVLQMPRGNLETISCRLISIDILNDLLNLDSWQQALKFLRLEKLNANLLFDLDPCRFLNSIDKFVQGVTSIAELTALCMDFENTKVDDKKIGSIFTTLFQYFDRFDYSDYINAIVVLNLNFFTLREALIYLQDLFKRSLDDNTLKVKLTDAIAVLKTYGCDQDKLFTESLLLYDLELTHLIASCCQLDPRIFEPHLNDLKKISELERRYQINLFAKKPNVAIRYLLRMNITLDVITEFITTHKVCLEAYKACPKTNQYYGTVSELYGAELSRRGYHQEAGLILQRADLFKEALDEFILSCDWLKVLDLLVVLKLERSESQKVINDLTKRLIQKRMVKEAAELLECYGENYEMAIRVLSDNYYFEEAVHIAKKYQMNDKIITDILPVLIKHKQYLNEQLMHLNDLYDKHRARLSQVRKTKVDKMFDHQDDDVRDDLFSEVGSTVSRSSRSSTASSRNRRKEEKKKQDLREGGVYEDIALIRALHSTVSEIYQHGEHVKSCCVLLLQESDASFIEIKQFYAMYEEILKNIESGVSEIWPSCFFTKCHSLEREEVAILENYENLDLEYRTPPSNTISWKLRLF